MSSKKQQLENGKTQEQTDLGTAAPVADEDDRIILGDGHRGGMRPSSYLITAVVETGVADLIMYGRVDGVWGLHSGRYSVLGAQGVIGDNLAVGTHHIVVEDVGLYDELFFVKSANNITSVKVRPILFGNHGS